MLINADLKGAYLKGQIVSQLHQETTCTRELNFLELTLKLFQNIHQLHLNLHGQ